MNTLQKYSPGQVIPTAPKDAVVYWDLLASQFARASVASQVMCGFALIELKKEMRFKQGGFRDQKPRDLVFESRDQKPKDSVFESWGEFIAGTFGFSDETARNRVRMAEGVRADFKKLGLSDRFKTLLQTHPSQWSEPDSKLLSDSLAKCTDSMTQADFFQKLGLAKKPMGNPNATGGPARKLTEAEQLEAGKKFALENSGMLGQAMRASNRDFFLCADLEVNAQIALLEAGLRYRRAWVNTPAAKRDAAVIAKMVKEDDK